MNLNIILEVAADRVRNPTARRGDRPQITRCRVCGPIATELRSSKLVGARRYGLTGIERIGVGNGTAIIYMRQCQIADSRIHPVIRDSSRFLHCDSDRHGRDWRRIAKLHILLRVIGTRTCHDTCRSHPIAAPGRC